MTTNTLLADGCHRLDLSLTLTAPFLFPGPSSGRFGLDRVALRDWRGRLAIPQDQVRGIVRDGLVSLGRADLVESLFGKGSGDASDPGSGGLLPDRGRIHFDDLIAQDLSVRRELAHRVKIDTTSGAAEEGHLLVIEQVTAPGTPVTFRGQVHVFVPQTEIDQLVQDLSLALSTPLCIGAMKSVGFGRVSSPTVVRQPEEFRQVDMPDGQRMKWRFKVDRPYLVNAKRIAENAFLGARDIPGGALKGLLAQNAANIGIDITRREVSDWLSALRVGFARPFGARPPLAASIVEERLSGRVNLAIEHASVRDPSLVDDWKEVETEVLRLDERTHTAIDASTGAARDNMLFSTIAVAPPGEDGKEDFVCTLTLPATEGSADSAKLLDLLASSMVGLGRTGAVVRTEALELYTSTGTPKPGRVALRLLSDGLLADPYADANQEGPTVSAAAAYAAFWKEVLPASNMIDLFARQHLAGGYLARRFAPAGGYRPWVLTDAGAVFVLDLAASDVPALETLLATGLCRKSLSGQSLSWKNCPFVAENGYGEIALYAPQAGKPETW
jgi:hypothetical protein